MRRFFSIILLGILTINFFGFYIAFLINRDEIRDNVAQMNRIGKQSAERFISYSRGDYVKIAWIDLEKEFRHNGILYDVAKIEVLAECVRVYVEEDIYETELISDFISTICFENEKAPANSPLKVLLSHFLQEFTFGQSEIIFGPLDSFLILFDGDQRFTSFVTDLQSPPPDFLLS